MKLAQLAERDEWICWVCENEVDPNTSVGSASSGSIDHVIPKSLGGDSSPGNLRLAHRKCNSGRGDKLPELAWPHADDLVDSAPLWPALLRMQKKKGTETVAFFATEESADKAASWVVMKATQLTGESWTVEVEQTVNSYAVKLWIST